MVRVQLQTPKLDKRRAKMGRKKFLKQASTFVDSPDHCANAEELLVLLTEEFY